MKKVLDRILFALSFAWQAPQSLIGLFMLIYFKLFGGATLISYKKLCYAFSAPKMSGGISLGNFAFLSNSLSKHEESIAHEQLGHTWDSKLMGPLYLFIVGIAGLMNKRGNQLVNIIDFVIGLLLILNAVGYNIHTDMAWVAVALNVVTIVAGALLFVDGLLLLIGSKK